jgi:hypothetical protein
MKKIILPFAVLMTLSVAAQNEHKKHEKIEVPVAVLESFKKDFSPEKAKWKKEKNDFEVYFENKGIETSAIYNVSGHRKSIEVEIKETELPAGVLDYVKKSYPTEKIKEFGKITDDKNVVTFEVEVKKDKESHDVIFDSKGTFLKYE